MGKVIQFPGTERAGTRPRRPGGAPQLLVYDGGHTRLSRLRLRAVELAVPFLFLVSLLLAMEGHGVAAGLGATAMVGLLALVGARQRPLLKGAAGEDLLAAHLEVAVRGIPSLAGSLLVRDVALAVDGHRFQIDHLLITPLGLFVFEAKAWSGPQQVSADGTWLSAGKPRKNPLRQVERQRDLLMRWLQKTMPADAFGVQVPVIGVVVWTVPLESTGPLPAGVLHVSDLVPYLVRFQPVVQPIPRRRLQQMALACILPDLGLPGGVNACGV